MPSLIMMQSPIRRAKYVASGDVTAPTVTGAAINTAGTTLTLTMSEVCVIGAGGNGGLTIAATGGAATATYSSGSGSSSFDYTINRTILNTETVTRTYVQPGNGIEDAAGNDLASFTTQAVTNNSSQTGGGSTITHTGSFGTKSSLTPLFYQFFDTADMTNGALVSGLGFSQVETSITQLTSDGLTAGRGCTTYTTAPGSGSNYPHIYYTPSSGQNAVYVMYHFKIQRIAGATASGAWQLKGPRSSNDVEYVGTPRITISFYPDADCASLLYMNLGVITDTVNDGTDDVGVSKTYKDRWRADDWNLIEVATNFGTVGNSDGSIIPYINGALVGPLTNGGFSSSAMPVRTASNHLIDFCSIHPGMDTNSANQYRMRVCDYYVDNTPERIVLGNASTWSACTDKIPLIPTAWSGNVTATMRKFPGITVGGNVWSYVINAAGTVSSAQLQVAI